MNRAQAPDPKGCNGRCSCEDLLTPLCVDLDGTILKGDSLWFSLCALVRQDPIAFVFLPFWLVKGKAWVKHQVARRVTLDPALLPYNEEMIEFLRESQKRGRYLALTTGANGIVAKQIAEHLGLFNEVLSSDPLLNLTGSRKLKALQDRFGNHQFDYAANAEIDLIVWRYAREAIVVSDSVRLRTQVANLIPVHAAFGGDESKMSRCLDEIRLRLYKFTLR